LEEAGTRSVPVDAAPAGWFLFEQAEILGPLTQLTPLALLTVSTMAMNQFWEEFLVNQNSGGSPVLNTPQIT